MGSLRTLRPTAPSVPEPDGQDWCSDELGAGISDEELAALAAAADPTAPLDPDALPLAVYLGSHGGLLPEWYMPAVAARARRWRWPVVAVVVFAFVLIASLGLCATYGTLGFA